jgi:hypothetical protein
MFDTRLIYQIVDLERRMQIENEKQGNYRISLCVPFSNSFTFCCKAIKTVSAQISNLHRTGNFSSLSPEQDRTPNRSIVNPL